MPELPEVEIVKRSLFKMINKARFIDIKIKNENLRYKIPKIFPKQLSNEKIIGISRKSKYLIFHFKHKLLLFHLGMTGKLLIMRKKDKKIFKSSFYYDLNILPKHSHIYFTLSNNLILIYNDVRRFGFLKLYKSTDIKQIPFLKKLGPEPIGKDFNIFYFLKSSKNRKKNIKSLLMDQTFVSGLGNIYVNEVLFMSQISPLKMCFDINRLEAKKIIFNIKSILKLAIAKGGSSIIDFKNTEGKSGKFQEYFKVYGKKGSNCSRISCKGKIKKILISQRSSFYCSECQK